MTSTYAIDNLQIVLYQRRMKNLLVHKELQIGNIRGAFFMFVER